MRQIIFILVAGLLVTAAGNDTRAGILFDEDRNVSSPMSVCWRDPAPQDFHHVLGRAWVREAVAETWETVAAVKFEGWNTCGADGADVEITIDDTAGPVVRYPDDGLIEVILNFDFDGVLDDAFNCGTKMRHCARAQGVHEFGHVLAFKHPRARTDIPLSVPRGPCRAKTPGDPPAYREYADWDMYSVMYICNPAYGMFGDVGDSELSAGDIFGAIQIYGANTDRVLDRNEEDDRFGTAFAVGDFNGDGIEDLAVGAPGEGRTRFGSFEHKTGRVYIFHGTPRGGLRPGQSIFAPLNQASTKEAEFGHALTAGDFDGDGLDDLAIGAYQMRTPNGQPAGMVVIHRGTYNGMNAWRLLDQSGMGNNEADDQFGWSLAAGDLDGDGLDDLAVGAPGEKPGNEPRIGYVFVFRGSQSGPVPWHGLSAKGVVPPRSGDAFGWSLAIGDFTGDGARDLAVGSNGISKPGDGSVVVFAGSDAELKPLELLQLSDFDTLELGELSSMGAAIAAGNLDNDAFDDLVVGVPFGIAPNDEAAGIVLVYRGSAEGMIPEQVISQHTLGQNEEGDRFGSAIAVGDLDADGRDDVVIGASRETLDTNTGPQSDAGYAFAYISKSNGLQPWQGLAQNAIGTPETGDLMGSAIAIGKFDRLGKRPQIVVAAPGEAPYDDPKSGYVFVYSAPDPDDIVDHTVEISTHAAADLLDMTGVDVEVLTNADGLPTSSELDRIYLWYGFGQSNY